MISVQQATPVSNTYKNGSYSLHPTVLIEYVKDTPFPLYPDPRDLSAFMSSYQPQFPVYAQFQTFSAQLKNLGLLEVGWDGADAEPPNKKSIELAQKALAACGEASLMPAGVSPSVEGGTSIYFVRGNKYADFEFFNDGEILAGMSDRAQEPQISELKIANILDTISSIKQFLND